MVDVLPNSESQHGDQEDIRCERKDASSHLQRRSTVVIYVIALALLHADYNLLAPNLTQIAQEFGMSEKERDLKLGGQITLSFFLLGIPSSIVVGWLADAANNRTPIFATVVLIGEFACFLTYFVKSFTALLIIRSITGVGIGASLPIVYSVVGDLYTAEGRNAVSGVISTALGLGIGIGQAIAGFVGPKYGWRIPFLIVSIPSFFVGIASFFLKDPKRGSKEKAVLEAMNASGMIETVNSNFINDDGKENNAYHSNEEETNDEILTKEIPQTHERQISNHIFPNPEPVDREIVYNTEKPSLKSTCKMLKTPTVFLILIQGAPSVIPFGIASTFLNDYLSQEKGLAVEGATSFLLLFGAGNAIGVIIGSWLGHISYKRDVRIPAILMGSGIILACIPMYFAINMDYGDGKSMGLASFMIFLAGFLCIFPIPIERAILSNTVLPEMRGLANSFLNIIDGLGKGLGPFLLSTMIASVGRERAFNLSLIGWLIGGAVSLLMFFTVQKDEQKVQEQIRDKMLHQSQRMVEI